MERGRRSGEIAHLERTLADERRSAETARRAAARWEREAVRRAASVAGALSAEILAGRRLAAAVRAHLAKSNGNDDGGELGAALSFFEEIADQAGE